MARYKITQRDQGKFIPVCFDLQMQPGTFEYTLGYLIDNKLELSADYKESMKDFKFADDLSYCNCPAGKRLYRNGGDTYTEGYHSVRFRGPKCHCLPCAL